jgi:hypothetical protein
VTAARARFVAAALVLALAFAPARAGAEAG